MHTRRLAALLLGAWLAGSIFMSAVATGNFAAVDRLLASPAPAAKQYIRTLGVSQTRALLRYQVSEQNRRYFEQWELVQLGLGIALVLTVVFATNGSRLATGLSLGMLVIVVILHWLITPQVITLGSALDFLPPNAPALERARFWRFHNAYTTLEVIKLLLGVALGFRLIVSRSHRRALIPKKVNSVNHSDHSPVNR
jgi:hypothetical protein